VICRVDFKSATSGNESGAALVPGKVSGRRGAAVLRPLVDGQHAPRKFLQRRQEFPEGKDRKEKTRK